MIQDPFKVRDFRPAFAKGYGPAGQPTPTTVAEAMVLKKARARQDVVSRRLPPPPRPPRKTLRDKMAGQDGLAGKSALDSPLIRV